MSLATTSLVVGHPLVIEAHGVGTGKDLPIPPELAIVGGVAALVLSFVVLAFAWRTPRWEQSSGRPAPARLGQLVDSRWWGPLWQGVGMVFFLFFLSLLVFAPDLETNPAFLLFMTVWWVGLVPLSLVFGPAIKALSPARTLVGALHRFVGNDPEHGVRAYPAKLGYWPAAFGILAFTWFELVAPSNTELSSVRLWVLLWLAIAVVGGMVFGTTWLTFAEPFEAYSSLVAKMSIWGRDEHGTLVMRSPLANLATTVPHHGLTALVAILFGSTAFDSFRESPTWVRFLQSNDVSVFWINSTMLVAFWVVAGALFALGVMATGVDPSTRRSRLPNLLAHSVVPIIVGYMFAHYLTALVEGGQSMLALMSDPYGTGADFFGLGNLHVNYWLSNHPTFLAVIKVLGVVVGHVVGVVAAHDRALALLPTKHQIVGQLSLLVTMVAFTGGGLYFLFAA